MRFKVKFNPFRREIVEENFTITETRRKNLRFRENFAITETKRENLRFRATYIQSSCVQLITNQ